MCVTPLGTALGLIWTSRLKGSPPRSSIHPHLSNVKSSAHHMVVVYWDFNLLLQKAGIMWGRECMPVPGQSRSKNGAPITGSIWFLPP